MAQESWDRNEETECQQPEGPILCANNCGFFGSKATMNLCSKCYRDIVTVQANVASAQAVLEKSGLTLKAEGQMDRQKEMVTAIASNGPIEGGGMVMPSSSIDPEEVTLQKQPNRCSSCNKRVGLTGFKCRCGDLFCSLHRYSDKHACSFDYKAAGRDAIAKANPIVKGNKVDKI